MDKFVNFIIWVLAVAWGLAQAAVIPALIALVLMFTGCVDDGVIERSLHRNGAF